MVCRISAAGLDKLRFNETDTVSSVLQNIAVILATPRGTVPMYREFGVPMDYLDMPRPIAEARMIAPIREAIQRWEPRAEVLGIDFDTDPEHPERLIPCVEVEINE